VTVAICTYNRAALLSRTLTHLVHLVPPSNCTWELVVVNNGSTDSTADVLERFRDVLPLRSVYDPKDGIANARNAAVAAASGDYIVWTDDDVFVHPRWLAEYVDAFRAHPDAAIFGGSIAPLFEPPVPSWLPAILPHVTTVYGVRSVDVSEPIAPASLPWGANFAIRTEVQRDQRFDPRFGHRHGRVMLGEETRALRAILAAGHTGWWVPSAKVEHFIPQHRQRWSHLASYWYAQGLSYATGLHAGEQPPQDAGPRFLGRPVHLWQRALVQQVMYGLRRLRYSKVRLVKEFANTRRAWGVLDGSRSR
jgi:glucosyl-dolichyl phosphate glucuronosyltransferase